RYKGTGREQLARRLELAVDLEPDHRLVHVRAHGASGGVARHGERAANAAASARSSASPRRRPTRWSPTGKAGRPGTSAIGSDSAGNPARLAATVKRSTPWSAPIADMSERTCNGPLPAALSF